MPLLFASAGDEVRVASVGGNAAVKQRLAEIGFTAGAPVSVVQKIATGLIVKVKGARIALDRAMAGKIFVC
ncbi:MAG: ferrous iron transport protein A [Treponema sp.]|nr:ferrous iron transport protein A [Treponema sp.]